MPRFPSDGPVAVTIESAVGHVELVASDRDDVVADVLPTHPGRSADESLASEATVEFDGHRLRIRVPRRLNLFGRSDSVDIRVEVPEGSALDVESAYGAVRLQGRFGDCRIVAKYGEVTADTVADLDLTAPYGASRVTEVRGALEAITAHGDLRVERVAGSSRVRASHGSIELGTTVGPVDVATSGQLVIRHALTDVTARSAHGSIRIGAVTSGSIHLENGYAGIEVGVAAGTAAWVDALSAHGTVRSELTPDPDAAQSERTVALQLRTNWADVLIRRAALPTGVQA